MYSRLTPVHLVGTYEGKVFEDREVTFDYGEGYLRIG